MLTFLSLFAGIGGLDLGLERASMRCVGQVEIDPFARAVLAKHWPDVPRWADVRTFGRGSLDGPVQLICGGFPCQDISVAGKGRQLEGERSGLWWEFHRIIGEFRPTWILAENVAALRNRGADDVLSSLEALGYAAWPLVVGAEHVGAPHRRHRVFIVAHAEISGESIEREGDHAGGALVGADAGAVGGNHVGSAAAGIGAHRSDEVTSCAVALADGDSIGCQLQRGGGLLDGQRAALGDDVDGGSSPRTPLADPAGPGLEGQRPDAGQPEGPEPRHGLSSAWPARPGEPQHGWEAPRLTQLPLGGSVDGVPVRLVRAANRHALRAFGNSVVPACSEVLGRLIVEAASRPRKTGQ